MGPSGVSNMVRDGVPEAVINEDDPEDAAAKLGAAAATRTVTKTLPIGLDRAKGVR